MTALTITHYSDILCIWAYVGQLRVDAVERTFGTDVRFKPKFCSVFGDAHRKIRLAWAQKGGFDGYADHVRRVASGFPEVSVKSDVWSRVRPCSSMSPHLFLKAAAAAEAAGEAPLQAGEQVTWALRRAFFQDGRDIAHREVQASVGAACGFDIARLRQRIDDGSAFAALAADYQDAESHDVTGSPTYVLNDGRQKLYGNIGFRVIEANIRELLRNPTPEQASWC
jgi:predicted DsbA family dithiol-disulfide isomerase